MGSEWLSNFLLLCYEEAQDMSTVVRLKRMSPQWKTQQIVIDHVWSHPWLPIQPHISSSPPCPSPLFTLCQTMRNFFSSLSIPGLLIVLSLWKTHSPICPFRRSSFVQFQESTHVSSLLWRLSKIFPCLSDSPHPILVESSSKVLVTLIKLFIYALIFLNKLKTPDTHMCPLP